MTDDEIKQIETELALVLPTRYRQLVTAYPDELYGYIADYDLLGDPDEVIVENRVARADERVVWRPELFVVGHNGLGDRFCLDLALRPCPVVFFDQHSLEFEALASCLESWCRDLLEDFDDAG